MTNEIPLNKSSSDHASTMENGQASAQQPPAPHMAMDPTAPHPESEQPRLRGGHNEGGACPGRFCFIIPCPIPINCCIIPCPC
ncbi:hypothetical protein VHEMI09662 [[Torrubiella] hemipterigena]|uniref:Uncharacterized protein n=1 Tax=[Torrubiella] hemipterigena TaxID=1531966 RepID=A0A0A1TAK0_9HYPO|nr:hypothetical protein VHEMI09662 [[Torrubiella] hemipterigena]